MFAHFIDEYQRYYERANYLFFKYARTQKTFMPRVTKRSTSSRFGPGRCATITSAFPKRVERVPVTDPVKQAIGSNARTVTQLKKYTSFLGMKMSILYCRYLNCDVSKPASEYWWHWISRSHLVSILAF